MHLNIEPRKVLTFIKSPCSDRELITLDMRKLEDCEGVRSEIYDTEQKAVERFLAICNDRESYLCYSSERELASTLSEAYRLFAEDRETFLSTYAREMDGSQDKRAVIFNHVCDAYYYEIANTPFDPTWQTQH